MSELFDERLFIFALTSRPEDARIFASKFRAEWLHNADYQPILTSIKAYIQENRKSPSLEALHLRFAYHQPDEYKARIQHILDDLSHASSDITSQLEVLNQAKDVAIVRSLQDLCSNPAFKGRMEDLEGREIVQELQRWMNSFSSAREDRTMSLNEAVVNLFDTEGFDRSQNIPIRCGIEVIDEWSNGGLKPGNLGIMVAPTGGGKSVALVATSHHVSTTQELPTWYITNEITLEDATSRFLARITGKDVGRIMNDPGVIASEWHHVHSKKSTNNLLWLSEYNRQISTAELEADMLRNATLYGWMPKVICLDYLEHMRPNAEGMSQDSSWNWIGAVAQDLVNLAKKHKLVIWTAAQTNRSGLSSDKLDLPQLQGSIKHAQAASAVVAFQQVYCGEDPVSGEEMLGLTIYCMKMRHGRRGQPVSVKCNLATMEITNEEAQVNNVPRGQDDDSGTPHRATKRTVRKPKAQPGSV